MKRIFAVFKKEIKRFFTDKRVLLSLIIPGVLIFAIYTIFGSLFSPARMNEIDKNYQFNVAISDNYNELDYDSNGNRIHGAIIDQGIKALMADLEYEKPVKVDYFNKIDENSIITKLKNQEYDVVISYETDNFEKLIISSSNPLTRPNVNVYFNSEKKESEILFQYVSQVMNVAYSSYTLNLNNKSPNVGEKSELMSQVVGMLIPMLTISILYSITITVCPEAIAGEKERGTLSAILITPIKRHEFAIGKVLALSVVSLFGGVITGGAVLASLPNLLKGMDLPIGIHAGEYALIFFIMLSLLFLFVNFAMMISTYAKSTKEATGLLGPLSVIFMLLGLCPGFLDCSSIGFAFIPVLGSSQTIFSLINGSLDPLFLGLTLLSNIIYAIIFVLIDVKLFKTESIVMRT